MTQGISELKIGGIYDKRTISLLKESGVSSFGFDFRPLSLNFIQGYVLESILESVSELDSIYLRFQNEPDFMVNNILDQFKDSPIRPCLVFSDTQTKEYYESFDYDFFWHFDDQYNALDILKAKNCKGISFSLEYLKGLHDKGIFHNFVSNLYTTTHKAGKDIQFSLNVENIADFFPSILEFFDFQYMEYQLGPDTEVCYRNIDSNKLNTCIKHLSQIQAL